MLAFRALYGCGEEIAEFLPPLVGVEPFEEGEHAAFVGAQRMRIARR